MARILVVDDEPDIQALITQRYADRIRRGEFHFAFAGNGREALDLIARPPEPDVLLTDLRMPVMDGLALLDALNGRRATMRVIVITAYGDMLNIRKAMNLGAYDFLQKPLDFRDLDRTLDRALLSAGEQRKALAAYRHNAHLKQIVDEITHHLVETQDAMLLSLAALAEVRDPTTGAHLERTRLYVKILGETLRDHPKFKRYLNEERLEILYKAVPLHDIGKVGVRDDILLKEGTLTDEEFEEMKRHVAYGAEALRWAEERLGYDSFLSVARIIVLQHHERWDGTGYPEGLRGDQIDVGARLMALADVYDALTSSRPYKGSWSFEEVRAFILAESGKHFDPDVVQAFCNCEDRFRAISEELAR